MRLGMAAIAALMAWAAPLNAEPGPMSRWLMNEPVNLFTRGMDEIRERVDRASDSDNEFNSSASATVRYSWDDNEINIYFRLFGLEDSAISHDRCNKVRNSYIASVTNAPRDKELIFHKVLDGYVDEGGASTAEWLTNVHVPREISAMFSQNSHRARDRDEDIGEKLARIIFVEVEMFSDSGDGISCRDRITSFDAPSKPTRFGLE
ncbi:MAG: hypothetical protein OXE94_03620 [Aestuariivita sp.]|nr:hypothetical protein [Aestuariivita sp.]MCY4202742.1 hypothetical protein [Aestuariivita sp.]